MSNASEDMNHKWGMVIDQDVCIGCQACIAACSMENNNDYVGESDAGYGRAMFWIRVERFWNGEYPEIKTMPFQPVMCQQCANAPCEPVCPVFAAVHSNFEKINLQVYNRCVGTRYCANNCPYQARIFNWRDYERPDPLINLLNPSVTERRRGVLEKCTFCLQRIKQGEDLAESEGREVRDGEVVPACAQACPTNAIVFGRLDDPESKVSQMGRDGRGYHLLNELNTFPSVTYLNGASPYGRNG